MLHLFINLILEINSRDSNHKILLGLTFPKCGLHFWCLQYYNRYEAFGSDLDNFSFIKQVENWTKFLISLLILTARKKQTAFWKFQDKKNLLFKNVKVGWRLNGTNRLATVMQFLHILLFRTLLSVYVKVYAWIGFNQGLSHQEMEIDVNII